MRAPSVVHMTPIPTPAPTASEPATAAPGTVPHAPRGTVPPAHAPADHVGQARIVSVSVTPVAFADPPLLNTVGVHEPYALRAIVQLHTDAGTAGLGETYGDAAHLGRLRRAADAIVGADPFNVNDLRTRVARSVAGDTSLGGHGMGGMVTGSSTADRVLAPFDVAALDLQGKLLGVPVSKSDFYFARCPLAT